ncbi:MAG: PASTA domain-containing protein, partial [Clostridia bacterium]|nr:PASTA domain-containing protein [Clostridia bacterium]
QNRSHLAVCGTRFVHFSLEFLGDNMPKIKYTTHSLQKRLLCVIYIVAFVFLCVLGKMLYVQVVQSEMLQARAISQWTRDLPLNGLRGKILDTTGKVLASSYTTYNVYVRKSNVENAETLSETLALVLDIDKGKILQKIQKKGVSEVLIAQQVDGEIIESLLKYKLRGVYIAETSSRQYEYNDVLCSVLGYTTIDNVGQAGIEAYYNKILTGTNGYTMTESTITGLELSNSTTTFVSGIPGLSIKLTINIDIQRIVEGVLNRAMDEQKAKGATAIVMDATNGEILAMARKPSFDLNDIPRENIRQLMEYSKNTNVVDIYEPGSTFKIFTMAAALSSGVTSVEDTFFDPGYRIISGERIKCWKTKGHGHQTLTEGLVNSCNCVFMDLGLRIGVDTLYSYLSKFGIGQMTNVDIMGESAGIMMDSSIVKEVDLARIAFGQAIAVTPLQMLNSVCGVVTGVRYQPRLIESVIDGMGEEKTMDSIVMGKTVTDDVRATINTMLEAVVSAGGECTFVPGYRVGGKTGTAQKYEDGKVAQGKYVSSFVGTYPANNPKYVMLVCVDEPSAGIYYGSQVAKPYGGMIFQQIFDTLAIPRDIEAESDSMICVPNVVGMSVMNAGSVLRGSKLDYVVEGAGSSIKRQAIPEGEKVDAGTIIQLYTE